MAKISILMLLYNTGAYLDKALSSIVNQTFTDIEIIIINDASPDSNDELIALEYAAKDTRIKYFKNAENIGAGFSFNRALNRSQSAYVQIVDPDDYLDLNALEICYNKAIETDVDFVCFGHRSISHDYQKITENNRSKVLKEDTLLENDTIFKTFIDNTSLIRNAGWSRLFKRSHLVDNKLYFSFSNRFSFLATTLKSCYYAKKALLIPNVFYNYYQRLGSLTQKFNLDNVNSTLNNIDHMYKFMQEKGVYEKHKDAFGINIVIALLTFTLNSNIKHASSDSEIEQFKNYFISQLRERDFFWQYIQNLPLSKLIDLLNIEKVLKNRDITREERDITREERDRIKERFEDLYYSEFASAERLGTKGQFIFSLKLLIKTPLKFLSKK